MQKSTVGENEPVCYYIPLAFCFRLTNGILTIEVSGLFDYFVGTSAKDILKEHELFQDLSLWGRYSLYCNASVEFFSKGEIIVEEGAQPDAFYIVVEGRCESFSTSEDDEEYLKHFIAGDSFGEQALLLDQPSSYSVRSLNDSILVRVDRSTFQDLTNQYPGLAYDLSLKTARQLAVSTQREELLNRRQITTIMPLKSGVGKTLFATNIADVVKDETDEPTALIALTGKDGGVPEMRRHDLDSVRSCDFYISPGDERPESLRKKMSDLLQRYRHLFFLLPPNAQTDLAIYLCEQSDELVVMTENNEEDLYEAGLFLSTLESESTMPRPVLVLSRQPSGHFNRRIPSEQGINGKTTHHLPELSEQALQDSLHHRSHALADPDTNYGRIIRRLGRLLTGKSVGLALGGGAARGLAHIGVLEVLENEGITVDMVAGSSIGALVGAAWARGASTEQMKEWAYDFAKNYSLWGFTNLRIPPLRGIFSTGRIEHFIEKLLGDFTFAELQLPLRVTSTSLPDIEEVVFSQGLLREAVRASISLPVLFPPVETDEGFLVDGAVIDPVPITPLKDAGVEHVIGVNAVPPVDIISESPRSRHRPVQGWDWLKSFILPTAYGNVIDIHMRALEIMQAEQSVRSCRRAEAVITPAVNRHAWHEFNAPGAFIKAGRRAARSQIDTIKQLTR